jgi:hypothetical protein
MEWQNPRAALRALGARASGAIGSRCETDLVQDPWALIETKETPEYTPDAGARTDRENGASYGGEGGILPPAYLRSTAVQV